MLRSGMREPVILVKPKQAARLTPEERFKEWMFQLRKWAKKDGYPQVISNNDDEYREYFDDKDESVDAYLAERAAWCSRQHAQTLARIKHTDSLKEKHALTGCTS